MTDDYETRKNLSFAQAEGVEELPRQLALKELSKPLRVRLLRVILDDLQHCVQHQGFDVVIVGRWRAIMYDLHVLYFHQYPDEFDGLAETQFTLINTTIKLGNYVDVFGFIQFILRHRECNYNFPDQISAALKSTMASYRLIDRHTIVPIASLADGLAIEKAFSDLTSREYNGARKHLLRASDYLNSGKWSDSVRESIHAVEAVSRLLEPKAGTLDAALKRLSSSGYIHPALKDGFGKLYGYTSDEQGIRHAHIDGTGNVDEADALYMFGACAAFVTYLIGKSRNAALLP